jgi:hypothetical protein
MSIFDEIETDEASAVMAGFQLKEGFARITRQGKTDVYLIQNREPLGNYALSIAFELDDFEEGKDPGKTFIVRANDTVQYLGPVKEYFAPQKPIGDAMMSIIRAFPRSVGLLPAVRAVESLKAKNRIPTPEEVEQAVKVALNDYHNRRAQLIA